MVNVYDFLVNFNNKLYRFYEWEPNDNVLFVRKSTIFKVSRQTYENFIKGNVRVSKDFLNLICNQTIILKGKSKTTIKYSCVIGSDMEASAFIFNNNGYIIKYSSFTLEDELEMEEVMKDINIEKISYEKIINMNNNKNYLTRKEEKELNDILYKLEKIKDKEETINYLYYEYFNKEPNNKCYEELLENIKNNYGADNSSFYKLLDIVYYNA